MSRRYTEAQRRNLFEEQQRTGEPLRTVARRLGIHEAAAYQWAQENKARAAKVTPGSGVKFAQVVRTTAAPCLVVEAGRATIRVPRGFNAEHLRQVVQALSEETQS